MKFHVVSKYPKDLDATIARVVEGEKKLSSPQTIKVDKQLGGAISRELKRRKFKTKAGETIILNTPASFPATHVIVLVVNKPPWRNDYYRRNNAELVKAARDHHLYKLGDDRSGKAYEQETLAAIAEGSLLGDYSFDRHKSGKPKSEIEFFYLPGKNKPADLKRGMEHGRILAEAQILARDLANEPPSSLTPRALADQAKVIGRRPGLRVTVFDEPAMRKAGLRGVLAVSKGSDEPARLIKLVYAPPGVKRHVALVGKGITYDSGGLNLKPPKGGGLELMKMDMSGGAAVIATMSALPVLKPKVKVTAYIAATENLLGGGAYKPGDVVKSYNGKTIEILDTDAEGRVTLADVLAYAADRDKPDEMVSIATLANTTLALGRDIAALNTESSALRNKLEKASESSGERIWELPTPKDYRPLTASAVADFANITPGKEAYVISGPLLLKHFVGKTPWAHIDIGGPAMSDKSSAYTPKGGTGWGTRLLLDYLSNG